MEKSSFSETSPEFSNLEVMEGNIFGLEINETPSMSTVIPTVKKRRRKYNGLELYVSQRCWMGCGLQGSTELWTAIIFASFKR